MSDHRIGNEVAVPVSEEMVLRVKALADHCDELTVRYLGYAGTDDNWANRAKEEADNRDALRAVLASLAVPDKGVQGDQETLDADITDSEGGA